ncbi:cryptochrome/photolyase family protein [Ectobacillus ponti]|uniref:Deoxyribodipyrimidine photo-lyase n=1 Tax=Ectobacillus ponti TaxID=2961894 RepID=A0AA41X3W8_9BACI|nr:deoxyribodipyrimidine photo-lyase [Ectobacillus ponti]MCP8968222.1 DNA photolyase family protein [Ectobacillus ponti]
MKKRTIVLFRRDFRLFDNPALLTAANRGAVLPVYIHDPACEGDWQPGGAAKWWLHHALADVKARLQQLGADLLIEAGETAAVLLRLVEETGANTVYWNRRYEPAVRIHDAKLEHMLQNAGMEVHTFDSHLLLAPEAVHKGKGEPYKVFSAYHKAFQKHTVPAPLPKVKQISSWTAASGLALSDLQLLPAVPWTAGMERVWTPTEAGGYERLKLFLNRKLPRYSELRDFPAISGNSSLAPYLAFGQLSPRLVHHYMMRKLPLQEKPGLQQEAESFLRQLVWREFSYHLLFHFPHTAAEPLQPSFRAFPWREDSALLDVWTKGQTGYPIVDAGMRELWETGFMHNRVRMIVASFLVKHLLIPWQQGAAWFWDTLLDADLANNTMGWQWTAGSGADAAPYFRIFNPVTQGEKFDKEGEYVRRWVPELGSMPCKYIHKPWEAPEHVLLQADVALGTTYPKPIVDHAAARVRALQAYEEMKRTASAN